MRVAVLTSMIAFGGAFSGLLAAGIMRINAFGYEGWSWIFFIVRFCFLPRILSPPLNSNTVLIWIENRKEQ